MSSEPSVELRARLPRTCGVRSFRQVLTQFSSRRSFSASSRAGTDADCSRVARYDVRTRSRSLGMPFNSDRRRFVSNLTGGLVTWAILQPAARAATSAEPRVNAGRLQSTLEDLSTFGRPAGGSFADGVSRVAYSDADVAGRAYVIGLMKAVGLDTTIDPAGNIVGRRTGSDRAAPPIPM